MAFAGTFLNKIKGIAPESSYPQQQPTAFTHNDANDDDDDKSSSHSTESKPNDNNSHEYTTANHPGILDTDLTSLTTTQRNIFIAMLTILFVLSMCGNMGTLFVNFRRKIRPFFRACLISLAFSDLMNTVFLTTAYLSQFTAEYVQIWRLGDLMCSLVPFATTTAILASSMTLVGIAVDRYFAVMKAIMGFWNPSLISCIACVFCIWLASIGIASPVFTIYDITPVYILTEEHETATKAAATTTIAITADALATATGVVLMTSKKPSINATMKPPPPMLPLTNVIAIGTKSSSSSSSSPPWQRTPSSQEDLSYTLVRVQQLVNMCVSEQKNVTLYYVIVFVIIFIPCLAAFFWFNSIIARKLWQRRHVAAITQRKTWKIKNKTTTPATFPTADICKTDGAKICVQPMKNCNCKSAHTSSTTVPSSLVNTLGGKVTISATTTTTVPSANNNNNSSNVTTTNSCREARHLRMFTIILLMMAVFVFLRLPAWIFLLMRMYGNYTKPIHWILYFVFGLMNLTSSVLNPLFYTFLTETIQYTLKFKAKVKTLICVCCDQVCCCNSNNASLPAEHGQIPLKLENVKSHQRCYGDYLRYTFCCLRTYKESPNHQPSDDNQLTYKENEVQSKHAGQAASNDKDEGVDCNDEIDEEDVRDFYEYNQRIYTIFSPSLVSSSVNSQTS